MTFREVISLALQQTLKALSDPTRREILNLLKSGRLSAGEIADHFSITPAAVSRHLSVLKDADLIWDTREGKFIFYELNTSVLEEIMLWLTDLKGGAAPMIKQYKKELIVSTLLALLPIAAGLLLWNRLPGQLATHWGMHGADRWSGKAAAVFLQPLLLLAAHYLVLFLVFRDAKNRNQSKKVVGLLFWIMPATSILVSGITYAVALGWKFRLAGLLYVGLGLMFAAIGNYFPKCRPNRTVGIRISWTLGSEENWNATHRFAGKVWVIGGLIMVLAALLPEVPGIIVTILAAAALSILPIAYSYRYHRIHGTKSEPDPLSKKISVGMLIFTAVIVVFVAVMLFTGNLHYRFDSDSFTVEASYFDDLTVKYDAIDGIEYREGNVDGTRTYGVGSFRLLLGTFENAEFGTTPATPTTARRPASFCPRTGRRWFSAAAARKAREVSTTL